MGRLSKDALLGASDLIEKEVELPSIGGSVKIRSLPAAYSNQASSEALELKTGARGEQTATVNTAKLEELQVLHALIEPKLNSIQEARTFMQNCGSAAKVLVRAIDEISGVDKEAIAEANARFPGSGAGPDGLVVGATASTGNGGPDLSLRDGGEAGEDHSGDDNG
jgi:hypothetical protein